MRYAVLTAAALVASVSAQSSETSSSSISIPPYSNPNTQYLTQTNSLGVVTGQPTLPAGGIVVTSQPAVETQVGTLATIPAGLPTGVTSIPIAVGNGTTPASYFTISVGSSTTVVVGAVPTGVSVSGVTGSVSGARPTGSGSRPTGSRSGSDDNDNSATSTNSDGSTATESAGANSSEGAAVANMVGVSGAFLGLGALVAAML